MSEKLKKIGSKINQTQENINKNNTFPKTYSAFSNNYIIKEDLERVWLFVSDPFYMSKLSNNLISSNIFLKGKKGNHLHSHFLHVFNNIIKVVSKCSKIKGSHIKRTISWDIVMSDNIVYTRTFSFYRVTNCKATLVKLEGTVKRSMNSLSYVKFTNDYWKKFREFMIASCKKYILNSSEHLEDYKSCIIKSNYEKAWNYIIDFRHIRKIGSILSGDSIEHYGPIDKKGTFWKCGLIGKENEKNYFLIKDVIQNKKRKFKIYILETFGINNNLPNHEMKIKVTKIYGDLCHLSILHSFKQKVTDNYLDLLGKVKTLFLKELKLILEEQ